MKLSLNKFHITFLLIVVLGITTSYAQNSNAKINELIEQKRNFNKNNKTTLVFKIQLYNGSETEAYKIKNNFITEYPEYNAKIIYKSPEWKTQVGDFETRLEADRILLIIKENFSGAIVLEDYI
ncbi:SPOR domain-containing protein [Lutibacter citreus]|uniref:SPOR domain-containing protein n=1 Tax=Lutibacter citreus TaxID=2138210 RepID=UPI000DBE07E9|nr:SPOR domain-containing protein [Lutibacter citreus]